MFGRKEDLHLIWIFCCVAFATAAATSSSEGSSGGREIGAGSAGGGSAIRLRVTPRHVTLGPEESVTIRCSARGGVSIIDVPYISFALMIDRETVLPLSSGIPGVLVVPEPWSAGTLVRYSSVLLTIGPQMYPFLRNGENTFVCQAQNINGDVIRQPFVVSKGV